MILVLRGDCSKSDQPCDHARQQGLARSEAAYWPRSIDRAYKSRQLSELAGVSLS
jgi:hypothetical protein